MNLATHPPCTSHCDSRRVAEFCPQSYCDAMIIAMRNSILFIIEMFVWDFLKFWKTCALVAFHPNFLKLLKRSFDRPFLCN